MTNLARQNQKVFAVNATNNGQFGSLEATTKVTSQDLSVLQSLPAYEEGWNNAVVSGEQLPSLEEFQALNYINTYQTSYLLQKGLPEWDDATTYYIGDVARDVASRNLYISITDNNTNNALTDANEWEFLGDLSNLSSLVAPVGSILTMAGHVATPPDGYFHQNGDAFLRSSYTDLADYMDDQLLINGNNATSDWGYRCTNPADPDGSRDVAGDYSVLPNFDNRYPRGSLASDTVTDNLEDALQNITGRQENLAWRTGLVGTGSQGAFGSGSTTGVGANTGDQFNTGYVDFDASRTVRTADETRPKSIYVTYFIKY